VRHGDSIGSEIKRVSAERMMSRPSLFLSQSAGRRCWLWLAVSILAAASMWSYVFITWPEYAEALSDLYPRWYGARELLLHGRDPYSQEVTREIQVWERGRTALPGEDEGRFAYPLYVSFLLAPTTSLQFHAVNVAAFWFLIALTGVTVALYLRHVNMSPPFPLLLIILILSLGSFPIVFAIRLRQLSLVAGFFIAAALALISKKRYSLAGVALALATIKPQLSTLLLAWLFFWTLGDWHNRQRLFWSFCLSMLGLTAGSEFLVHGWITKFVSASIAYVRYTDGRSILQVLLTRSGGAIVAGMVIALFLVYCYRSRKSAPDSYSFSLLTALVLSTTLAVIPTVAPHGQILLVPGMLLLVQHREIIWKAGRYFRLALVATWLLLVWQWVSAAAFTLTAATLAVKNARRLWMIPLSTSPVLPLAVALTIALTLRVVQPNRATRQRSETSVPA
jgi:hypothetical protein